MSVGAAGGPALVDAIPGSAAAAKEMRNTDADCT